MSFECWKSLRHLSLCEEAKVTFIADAHSFKMVIQLFDQLPETHRWCKKCKNDMECISSKRQYGGGFISRNVIVAKTWNTQVASFYQRINILKTIPPSWKQRIVSTMLRHQCWSVEPFIQTHLLVIVVFYDRSSSSSSSSTVKKSLSSKTGKQERQWERTRRRRRKMNETELKSFLWRLCKDCWIGCTTIDTWKRMRRNICPN